MIIDRSTPWVDDIALELSVVCTNITWQDLSQDAAILKVLHSSQMTQEGSLDQVLLFRDD